ncbi:MAG: hypothetical protein LBJ00_17070, partial [Planctomycetaceae bacterium]|nr:hypothetical protein [Planctomycetaceae bacterium]
EKEKLVWFGQIGFCPQEQFIYFKDELILFNPAAVSLEAVEFDRGLVENSKMTEIKDQTSEVLDKFVNVNFPYKHELTYRGMRCRFYDYFDNPNFTIGRGAREIKKLSVEKGLVRLDIGLRAGTQMSYVPDGTLWFDLKKGTLERVEDRTEYPPRLANERVIRESE